MLTDSLISYWELEEASGTRNDSHGTNHLTDNNTVTQAVGKVGNAAQFTAASSESLSIADNAALSTGDIDFTFCFWVYLDDKSVRRALVVKSGAAGLREYLSDYNINTDRFRVLVSFDGTTNTAIEANNFGSPSTGVWYFVVFWHDAAGNTINISVNDGTADSAAYTTGVFDSTSPFVLGEALGTVFHSGRLDQVGFWKRVLTAGEKTTIYNGGAGLSYAALVALGARSRGYVFG